MTKMFPVIHLSATVDSLYALGTPLYVPMEEILVPRESKLNIVKNGQQDVSCCPFLPGSLEPGMEVCLRPLL